MRSLERFSNCALIALLACHVGAQTPSSGAVASSNKHGTGTQFQMFGGGVVNPNDCVKFDAKGNIVSAGAPCGSGTSNPPGGTSGAIQFNNGNAFGGDGADFRWNNATKFLSIGGTNGSALSIGPTNFLGTGVDIRSGLNGNVFIGPYDGSTFNGATILLFSNNDNLYSGQFYFDAGNVASGDIHFRVKPNLDGVATDKLIVRRTGQTEVLGNLAKINNVSYVWPTGQGSAGTVLTNDGSGNLTWTAPSAAGSGTGSNITQIQGRNVAATAPTDGQALVWSAAANTWQPGAISAGSGAGMSAQLGDFNVRNTAATVLTIGGNCSTITPCNIRFGNTTYSFVSSATITVSGGSGTAFIYVAGDGRLAVGTNLIVNCSGCTAQSGITNFPGNSVPLFTWTATNGVWDAGGGMDRRAFLSGKNVVGGLGIVAVEVNGQTTLALDSAAVGLRVGVPATATTPCSSGSWATDAAFFYICYADNNWRRVATAAW